MKTKQNKKYLRKTYKNRFKRGGFFGPFKRQLTTQEDLENLKNEINNTKLKNIEEMLTNEIEKMNLLRKQCIDDCKSTICSKNDAIQCSQINDMISTKTDYEWGNLCNSIKVESCKKYLNSLKTAEFYTSYVNNINNIMQQKLLSYKNSIKNL
jgi:hypothetical protein